LLWEAGKALPEGWAWEIADYRPFPLYDADVDAQGTPEAVAACKDQLAGADALLLVSPEYNHGVPGVLKNAIDWLSRPPKDSRRVFGDLPVALAGVSAGGFGTMLAQSAWLPTLKTLGMRIYSERSLLVSRGNDLFEDGQLADEETRERLRKFVVGFAEFAAALPRRR
jgi:chromate reductase